MQVSSSRNIKYTSINGYTGVLYGVSSYKILDKNGVEVFHTGKRSFNTLEALIEDVEAFPEFLKILNFDEWEK